MAIDEFFAERKDWSARKHLILEYYLVPATAKLSTASSERRVFILDGFAGPGRYSDLKPGSPLVTANVAERGRGYRNPLDIRIHNVERKKANFKALEESTKPWVDSGLVTNWQGSFQDHRDEICRLAGDSPLYAFLDPYAPKQLLLSDVVPLLQRNAITEISIVVFTGALKRIIHAAVSPFSSEKNRERLSAFLTRYFGNDRWKQLVTDSKLG